MNRLRQTLLFERLLVRIFETLGDRAVAKGGVALELRLQRARTTKDLDLMLRGRDDEIVSELQRAGRLDAGDNRAFTVELDRNHPAIEGPGVIYGGRRLRARALLAGRPYGTPFGVDVAVGDLVAGAPDVVAGSQLLDFIGVPRPQIRIYPRDSHVAEKLHAYTQPRPRENTRVRDLPDMALLATTGPFDGPRLLAAIRASFSYRGSHEVPMMLPEPPPSWAPVYGAMAESDRLRWPDLSAVFDAARRFLDPVLAGKARQWEPASWTWQGE